MSNESIYEITRNKEWQEIRKSLLNKWKTQPEKCCKILKNYLGNIKDANTDKLRILKNYLYSSGFRIGIISHPCIKSLQSMILSELKIRKYSNN